MQGTQRDTEEGTACDSPSQENWSIDAGLQTPETSAAQQTQQLYCAQQSPTKVADKKLATGDGFLSTTIEDGII
ncbi:hypothetical protein GGI12_006221, partial [Dipsacomyces acuminosporus]